MKRSTKRKPSDLIAAIIIGCVFIAAVIYMSGIFGLPASRLEKDARSSQKISDDWTAEGTVSKQMAAYIFYPEDMSDHTYSFYVNRPGLSFGYFFRSGGSTGTIEEYVQEFVVQGFRERAYISMNKPKIERVEINDGSNVETIALDSDKPFTLILSVNEEDSVTFYDVDGNIVESSRNPV